MILERESRRPPRRREPRRDSARRAARLRNQAVRSSPPPRPGRRGSATVSHRRRQQLRHAAPPTAAPSAPLSQSPPRRSAAPASGCTARSPARNARCTWPAIRSGLYGRGPAAGPHPTRARPGRHHRPRCPPAGPVTPSTTHPPSGGGRASRTRPAHTSPTQHPSPCRAQPGVKVEPEAIVVMSHPVDSRTEPRLQRLFGRLGRWAGRGRSC